MSKHISAGICKDHNRNRSSAHGQEFIHKLLVLLQNEYLCLHSSSLQNTEYRRDITNYISTPISGKDKYPQIITMVQAFKKFLVTLIFPRKLLIPGFKSLLVLRHAFYKLARCKTFSKFMSYIRFHFAVPLFLDLNHLYTK
ncbi:hypothetical protein D3C76_1249680 [compost metagenome]